MDQRSRSHQHGGTYTNVYSYGRNHFREQSCEIRVPQTMTGPTMRTISILEKVDPLQIVIDRKLLKPTDWDMKAVAEDLIAYVQTTWLIKATPTLHFMNGKLVVLSGEPFVKAAQEVIPPLKEVVCLIEESVDIVRHLGLSIVTASEMLDDHPVDKMYHAVEMLAFARTLTNEERNEVEDTSSRFFKEVSTDRASYGGNYSSISSFEWDYKQRTVKWTWLRNDKFGCHAVTFLSLLRALDSSTAPLSSWNGLARGFRRQMIADRYNR